MKTGDVVLVDTNVIIEGHIRACWSALSGAYRVETVEECIAEAMRGRHDWQQTRPSEATLRQGFHAIHAPSRRDIAQVLLSGGAMLDEGERHLWAHALTRQDAWILCGPDRASMRYGYEQQRRDRLVSLGGLLRAIDFRPAEKLPSHFQEDWLDDVFRKLILGIL